LSRQQGEGPRVGHWAPLRPAVRQRHTAPLRRSLPAGAGD
jgi:hypothetical protein